MCVIIYCFAWKLILIQIFKLQFFYSFLEHNMIERVKQICIESAEAQNIFWLFYLIFIAIGWVFPYFCSNFRNHCADVLNRRTNFFICPKMVTSTDLCSKKNCVLWKLPTNSAPKKSLIEWIFDFLTKKSRYLAPRRDPFGLHSGKIYLFLWANVIHWAFVARIRDPFCSRCCLHRHFTQYYSRKSHTTTHSCELFFFIRRMQKCELCV